MSLNVKAFALSSGVLWGAAVFIVTLVSLLRGFSGQHVLLLAGIYPGYQVTYLGSLIGLVYGFVTAAIAGAVFAWLYNKLGKQE